MSKNVGAAPSLDDVNDAMTSRYTSEPAPEPQAAAEPAQPAPAAPSQRPAMTRRSWLLPAELAEEFAAAAGRIHHGSGGRISKSEAQAALLRAGLAHEDEIASSLSANDANDRT